ncbi:MAG: hypothetical protein EOM80_12570, partial [Erysipelotrichia bacterium]|nr:hypothetical protein [Erysipelotrichia bacterium]
ILTEVLQVRTLLLRSAFYMGVDGQQIVFDLVFLLALPVLCALFAGYITARPAAKPVGWAMTSMAIMLTVVHYLSFNAVCAKVSLVEYIPVRLSTGLIPLPLHPVLQNSGALQKALSASPLIDNEKCYQSAKIDWPDNGCEKIVFIGIESLRYDAFASLMPNLKNIAARGKLFCDHYSTSNISLSSFYSIMHANFPVNLIFSDKLSKRSAFEEAAIRAGYQTVLIKPDLISDSEFEYWSQSQIVEKIDKPWRSTPVILDRTFEQLRKPGKGVYLSYIFNTHFNYFYPPETELFKPVCAEDANIFMLPPTEENIQQIRNRYKNSVLWADKCLSAFFKAVYDEGIDKKTLFVIFGDHGQSLRENGCLGHSTGAHQLQYRVPFIIVGRGVVPAEVTAPSSHMNILGAVSEYAGFRIISSFAGIADKYPLLALDESVMGRVLVIHENFINIFDLASNNRLRWIALMGRNYNLTPELVKTYYEDVDKLAETVAADFSFITAAFAREQSN